MESIGPLRTRWSPFHSRQVLFVVMSDRTNCVDAVGHMWTRNKEIEQENEIFHTRLSQFMTKSDIETNTVQRKLDDLGKGILSLTVADAETTTCFRDFHKRLLCVETVTTNLRATVNSS